MQSLRNAQNEEGKTVLVSELCRKNTQREKKGLEIGNREGEQKMSNFHCAICGTDIIEDEHGFYATECEHYPLEQSCANCTYFNEAAEFCLYYFDDTTPDSGDKCDEWECFSGGGSV